MSHKNNQTARHPPTHTHTKEMYIWHFLASYLKQNVFIFAQCKTRTVHANSHYKKQFCCKQNLHLYLWREQKHFAHWKSNKNV